MEGKISVQKDVNRLEKLADRSLMNFRKEIRSPTCRKERQHRTGHSGSNSLGNSFLEECPRRGTDGQDVKQRPLMCPRAKERQLHP